MAVLFSACGATGPVVDNAVKMVTPVPEPSGHPARAEFSWADIKKMIDSDLAKKARDFKRSDEIRNELKALGWMIEDSPSGIKLKKI